MQAQDGQEGHANKDSLHLEVIQEYTHTIIEVWNSFNWEAIFPCSPELPVYLNVGGIYSPPS